MITCFSFFANGYTNYNAPHRSINDKGNPVPFRLMGATRYLGNDQYETIDHFAYATREAALGFDMSKPAIPRKWARMQSLDWHVTPRQ